MYQVILRQTARKHNLARYYTGKPCKHGHISIRHTVNGCCDACYRLNNPLTPKRIFTDDERAAAQKENKRRWYLKNKSKAIETASQWKKDNPDKMRESERRWRKKSTSKSITFMRDSLRRVLKLDKNGRTEKLLGYTRHELVAHIERQFAKGMSWDNYGEWHIDHIESISTLLSSGVEDPSIINCLTNLRPMWAKENQAKSSKVEFLI